MNRQIREFKDMFEIVREREKELRSEGARHFWERLQYRLAQIHPETDITVQMFTEIIESEAELWILHSAHAEKKTAE